MSETPPFTPRTRGLLREIGWLEDERAAAALRVLWSGPDPDGSVERLAQYVTAATPEIDVLGDPEAVRRIAHLAGASPELCRQLTHHPRWLVEIPRDDPVGTVRATLARVAGDDLAGQIDVAEGGRLLSGMADELVGQILDEVSGVDTPPMAVIAFGKWGGTELNYWSDIDLGFVYDGSSTDADAANRTARAVMQRLGNGEDGLVINADAGLRPEGSRGPLARSLTAYRVYYERWAEPWEFQALLKVRPAAGDSEVGAGFLEMVEEVLWPETIDPDTIRSLRSLKARVEAGAQPGDLKRAPGGIRDVEFAIQMLQLVHGRFDRQLRRTSTLGLIEALTAGDYVDPETAQELERAYRWLRAVEHRLQLWELHQTHLLPPGDTERERLARTMGYRDGSSGSARDQFEADLVLHRSTVRRIHQDLYFRPLLEAFAATPVTGLSREGAERRLTALGFRDVPAAVRTFEELTAGLSRRSRMMHQMLPLIIDWLADSPDPDLGLDQLRLLAADTHDHRELIAALHERPVAGSRLAFLLGSSRLLGQYLDRIPEFLPRLSDDQALTRLRRQPELEQRLRRRVDSRPEMEEKEGTIRRFARRQILRVAARDLLSMAGVDDTMTDLTDAADAATRVAASVAMTGAPLAVIALGRWGGSELSYGSDLDLIYIYDGSLSSDSALDLAVRFRDLLARPAGDGVAYDLDTGLRPEGRSGPLVRSLASYRAYYQRWAQTWELQALVKARPVAGDPDLGEAFMAMIDPFVWRRPFPPKAASEVRQMKARIEKERIPSGENPDFHLKLGPGGLVDVEFLAQLLQLNHGGENPAVRVTPTLEALDRLGEAGALTPDEVADLAAAYRFCTHVRNRLFLQSGRQAHSLPTDPTEEWRLAMSLGYQRRGDLREDYRRVTRRARRIFTDRFF
ncbi:MAG: bifunctional [glutamine synthetase] adenylyltransferase/[glutamine synthetase]-adenylyl-L-tyrosine phosphorylase [Acidimicrobiia bacterium]